MGEVGRWVGSMGRGGRIGQKIGGAGKGGCERLGTEKDRDGLGEKQYGGWRMRSDRRIEGQG